MYSLVVIILKILIPAQLVSMGQKYRANWYPGQLANLLVIQHNNNYKLYFEFCQYLGDSLMSLRVLLSVMQKLLGICS